MQTRVSLSKIEIVKKELGVLLPDVKSSHRVEAMARGLGWNTNAALRTELAGGPTIRPLDEAGFGNYLKEHGYTDVRNGVLAQAVNQTDIATARAAIMAVMKRETLLTPNGYPYSYERMSAAEREAKFDHDRASMVSDDFVQQFIRAQEFLYTVPRTKRVTRKVSSYGYKHQAEEFQKQKKAYGHYVSNGMFIAAALDLGFLVARIQGSPNAFLNIGSGEKNKTPKTQTKLAVTAGGKRRLIAWQNIMIAGINAGLAQGYFGLEPDDNRWEGEEHVYDFELDGLPAIAYVRDIGHGELSFHVAVNPTEQGKMAIRAANAGFYAGEAFGAGWLERKDGTYLQSSAPFTSFRRPLLEKLARLNVEPNGFATNDPLRM